MRSRKTNRTINFICIVLILSVAGFRHFGAYFRQMTFNTVVYLMFSLAAFLWISQVRRRIIDPGKQKYLVLMVSMELLLMALRTWKYVFIIRGPYAVVLLRYGWYLYYVPILFSALFALFSVLHIGLSSKEEPNPRWQLLYIPTGLFALGILTNDLHQLAFRFEGTVWTDEAYSQGILFWLTIGWYLFLLLAAVVIGFRRCLIHKNRRKLWIPLMTLGICVLMLLLIFLRPDHFSFRMPEVFACLLPVLMESMIQAGFFPSNDGYADLWNLAVVEAGVLGRDGILHYPSGEGILTVPPEKIIEARKGPVLLPEREMELRSCPIPGGTGCWLRDISQINVLKGRLADMGDVLAEENAILKAENELEENRIRLEQENALYDGIARRLRSQINAIYTLLTAVQKKERPFLPTMQYICILTAYVKRYSNLLLHHREYKISADELRLCLGESMEYVRLAGIKAHGEYHIDGNLGEKSILLAYEIFEAMLEASLPGARTALLYLFIRDHQLTMNFSIDAPTALLPGDFKRQELSAVGGSLSVAMEENTASLCLTIKEAEV